MTLLYEIPRQARDDKGWAQDDDEGGILGDGEADIAIDVVA